MSNATKIKTAQGTIETTNGYAVGARCTENHAGNKGLAQLTKSHWQCQGCRADYTNNDVISMQRGR